MNKKRNKNRKGKKDIEQTIFCPYCGSKARLVKADFIYGEKAKNPDEFIYVCSNFEKGCNAYVTTHKGTKIPKGFMADSELRNKRIEVHHYISQLIESGYMKKADIYSFLNIRIPYGKKSFHVATSDKYCCDLAIRELKKLIRNHERQIS